MTARRRGAMTPLRQHMFGSVRNGGRRTPPQGFAVRRPAASEPTAGSATIGTGSHDAGDEGGRSSANRARLRPFDGQGGRRHRSPGSARVEDHRPHVHDLRPCSPPRQYGRRLTTANAAGCPRGDLTVSMGARRWATEGTRSAVPAGGVLGRGTGGQQRSLQTGAAATDPVCDAPRPVRWWPGEMVVGGGGGSGHCHARCSQPPWMLPSALRSTAAPGRRPRASREHGPSVKRWRCTRSAPAEPHRTLRNAAVGHESSDRTTGQCGPWSLRGATAKSSIIHRRSGRTGERTLAPAS